MSEPSTVYLVDASPYIFRAFFSLPDSITAPSGEPVNAAYGFASFLIKLIDQEEPTHLALAFDGSLTTSFRNDLYPAYKAQRDLPPPALEAQLDACREIGAAFGVACFIDDRYEADDILAALVGQLTDAGHRAVVVTSDKDLAQLVDDGVTLLDFAKDVRMDAALVREKFGVEPRQIPDFLGLAGDPVDNIPGVAGIGKKTAAALLAEMGDLETVYQRLEEVEFLPIRGARSVAKKLAEQREMAFLSKKLATAAADAPYAAGLGELELAGADPGKVDPLFERLGFEGIRGRIRRWR